ncbi:hypothetical protein BPAE_0011g00660 [Botrytis paeoniae]|uniref:Uncharacterized protein n=1 Tax=Botrytis paeoniae TaxID=278948 RepID=A0A4Z1FY96_9HELO|nr:hypothetical protein BPAE_0011g00660 [Botrytis paeoniae]
MYYETFSFIKALKQNRFLGGLRWVVFSQAKIKNKDSDKTDSDWLEIRTVKRGLASKNVSDVPISARVDQNGSAEIFFKSERKKTAIPTKNRYGVDAAIPIALVSTE